jgi:outer membrane protein TolC
MALSLGKYLEPLLIGRGKMMMGRLTHFAMAILTAASLVVAPVSAQTQAGQTQDQSQAQATTNAANPSGTLKVPFGPDYSNGPNWFPNIIAPYKPIQMPDTIVTNSPKLDQLVSDGKLMLSLEDAISIALENNLDISIQRFTPWIAQTDLLRAKAGGVAFGLGSSAPVVLGSGPAVSFDPTLTAGVNWSRASIPVNNPFLSGTGTTTTPILTNYNANYNFAYNQGFHTGTNVTVAWDNNRSSTTSAATLFNPAVQSTMTFTVTQPLMRGFGILYNTRFIVEAKNTVKVADSLFAQQVMATVAAVSNDYWELVFARENVKVQQAAVGVSTKLYEDNKKQLEIGTMAPLDVLTAESQMATDQQNLIVALTNKLQQETILLIAITKDPLAGNMKGTEIVPTTPIGDPQVVENIPLDDAVKEAWQKRPEILQSQLNLKNAQIEVKATKNALLPQLNIFGQYSATGLNGNQILNTPTGAFTFDPNQPIVNNGNAPVVPLEFVGLPVTATTVRPAGLGDALNTMVNNNFPTYAAGLNFTLPIRNRSAQADSARALLDERQIHTQYRQTQNNIVLSVRNALIALQQGRAQVAAAAKARELAQQTLDAEQKKYQLGSSTSYQVVLRSRDLTSAQGTELRAKVNLEEAVVAFNQAMGRTLEASHIVMADALRGKIHRELNIPGTPESETVAGK